MPTYTYPGVYIEEIPSGVRTITGVATSITAFIGRALKGPVDEPVTINSFADFERIFGGLWVESTLGYAVGDFYLNGGSKAVVIRLFNPMFANETDWKGAHDAAIEVGKIVSQEIHAQNPTLSKVSSAARNKANEFDKEPGKTAANIVAKRVEAATKGAIQAIKNAAKNAANSDENSSDPRQTISNFVLTDCQSAAEGQDATADSVKDSTRNSADVIKAAAQAVAEATANAAQTDGATPEKTKDVAWEKVETYPAGPQKIAASMVANAVEEAAEAVNTSNETLKNKAQEVAEKINAAAESVAAATEEEFKKILSSLKDVAEAALGEAAPRGKAKLQIDNLELEASSEGAWGNHLRARVDHNVSPDVAERMCLQKTDLFNLTLYDSKTGSIERHLNLSVKDSPRRVDRVLSEESDLVRVKVNNLPSDIPEKHKDPETVPNIWKDDQTSSKVTEEFLASDGRDLAKDNFIGTEKAGKKEGLFALEKADLFNLLCIPPLTREEDTPQEIYQKAMEFCKNHRAMLICDPPPEWKTANDITKENNKKLTDLNLTGPSARNAAIFFPWVKKSDPLREGQICSFAPCGIVAGIIARTDATRGVWKAPAGLDATLNGVQGLEVNLTDDENGMLNPLGVNCLRSFPVTGRVVWGARTLRGADQLADEYKYIPVRRLALFIEESLYRGTQWVVFEPNDEPLWSQIRLNVGAFMHDLFRQGAFQGKTPREAYLVKCDQETTTQSDRNQGIVNILVGFAPLKPAEFVVIKIQQLAGQL